MLELLRTTLDKSVSIPNNVSLLNHTIHLSLYQFQWWD